MVDEEGYQKEHNLTELPLAYDVYGAQQLPEECFGDRSAGLSAVSSWNITSPGLKFRLCPLLAWTHLQMFSLEEALR